jgi:hypothetical protein
MKLKDIMLLVEEICSLRIQAEADGDREDYGAARSLDQRADILEKQLRAAGLTLEENEHDSQIVHVLTANGTRYGSFSLDVGIGSG